MRSCPYRNALTVDHGSDVMRMRALHFERDHRSFATSGADQTQRIDLTQASLRIIQKIMLVRGDPLLAYRIDVVDRGAKADRLDDRRGAGLEFVRRIAISDPIPRH